MPCVPVVDDDREAVGPVAVPVADREVAGRRDIGRARPDGPVHPGLAAAPERRPKHRTVESPRTTAAGTAGPVHGPCRAAHAANVARVQSQP